ncbi:MAG: glycoside hydrolase family 3 N-terminal domain-containing protein [Spirochaetia bacterium]
MRALTLVSLVIALASASFAYADTPVVDALAARGRLGIPLDRARALESELGQLFIVNVDGFGYAATPLALEPDFAPMVEQLQIGGVIPHYGTSDYQRIRRTNRALSGMTRLPLLICSDIVRLTARAGKRSVSAAFGDGYVGGFIGKYKALADAQFETLAGLNAFVFAALGMNVALGPTVDDSTREPSTEARARVVVDELRRFGILPVLKHFPFLPTGANLHRSSPDTHVPLDIAEKRFSVFRDLDGVSPILMTTHLDDSLVDNRIVTFSSAWLGILRHDTGYTGLLMSDGLLMLRNYADKRVLGGVPARSREAAELAALDPAAAWAIRAILAGHDFVIVEGSAAQTRRAFDGVLSAACRGSSLGNDLARRIEESFLRIRQFKADNEALLSRRVDVSPSAIGEVIAMTPGEGTDLHSFRFNADALEAVAPELDQAAVDTGEPTP